MLEYGALIIVIYACMFGPVIAGLVMAFKSDKIWHKIVGGLIVIAIILLIIKLFIK